MRAIWKGTISFGLVNIPVALGIAAQRSDPKFRTLDSESLQPIRHQLYSPAREDTVERDQTVKGFEVSKDRYVVVTDEELESVAVERRKTIDILAFIDAEEVDPVYFDRTYYLQPQEHAAKPYALLLQAMKETGKTAVGKLVLSSKEHLALLRPSGDALVIELLFYPEDVRPKTEIEDGVRETKVSRQELEMATQLVESLSRPFDPAEFENEHKRDLVALVEKKMAGEEITIAPEPPAAAPVPDLMSALKASLEQSKGEKRTGAKKAKAARDGAKSSRDGAKSSGDGRKPSSGKSRRKSSSKTGAGRSS
jgi:DNA end-binding protein Ku